MLIRELKVKDRKKVESNLKSLLKLKKKQNEKDNELYRENKLFIKKVLDSEQTLENLSTFIDYDMKRIRGEMNGN